MHNHGYESTCEVTSGRPCFECMTVARNRLRTLAHNLAISAALCASWWRGWMFGSWEFGCRTCDDDENPEWLPGCGRSTP